MNVHIVFTDSGTGEQTSFDNTVGELTGEELLKAFDRQFTSDTFDATCLNLASFVTYGEEAAFILTSDDSFWGELLWVGIVYSRSATFIK